MSQFELDPRLAEDCLVLGRLDISLLLLMNNALVPWFILVPRTSEKEITDLPRTEQAVLLDGINLMADFIRVQFPVSKLNIASIGNVVSQLHVHIVGRDPTDYCWPGVVWGAQERQPYDPVEIGRLTKLLRTQLGGRLISIGARVPGGPGGG